MYVHVIRGVLMTAKCKYNSITTLYILMCKLALDLYTITFSIKDVFPDGLLSPVGLAPVAGWLGLWDSDSILLKSSAHDLIPMVMPSAWRNLRCSQVVQILTKPSTVVELVTFLKGSMKSYNREMIWLIKIMQLSIQDFPVHMGNVWRPGQLCDATNIG